LYWTVGLPALAAALLMMGWLWPRGAWRWAAFAAAGQSVAMVVFAPGGSGLGLLPLALAAILLVSLPLFVPVYLGVLGPALFRPRGGGPPPPPPSSSRGRPGPSAGRARPGGRPASGRD